MEREIALDTETTGFKPQEGHRMVEIGAVELINRIPTGKTFHYYLNPERDVPEAAFNVHGISTDFLKDKPLFEAIADELLAFIGDSKLVIHNADFDMNFLNAELTHVQRPNIPKTQAFCTLIHARKLFPGAPASLDALCKRFNVSTTHRTHHGALLDAQLLADMYLELMGGAQVGIAFGVEAKQEAAKKAAAKKPVREPRPFFASDAELEAHNAFVAKLKNALWTN